MPVQYRGAVEYASSGQCVLEIDDLDAPNWVGQPAGLMLVGANRPEVWFVGVVLLQGPRAGQFATADLIVQREHSEGEPAIRFAGKSAFALHPEFVDLDQVRRRFEHREGLRRRVGTPLPEIDDYADREPGLAVLDRPRRPREQLLEPGLPLS